MIRDPSDGTVREKPSDGSPSKSAAALQNVNTGKALVAPTVSGLATDKLKSDELARLAASREWVKNWHQRKTESAGESNEPTQSTSQT